MRKCLIILASFLCLFFSTIATADRIDVNTARKIAVNFYYEYSLNDGENTGFPENLVLSYTEYSGNEEMYYVFSGTKGYIIISADNDAFPVLAYSFEGKFEKNRISPECKAWMNDYIKQIQYIKSHSLKADQKISSTWNTYLADNFVPHQNKNGTKSMDPLLMSTWDQGAYYNYLCPEDTGGQDGHVWAGCVATAMAQVMYYYRYPPQGSGSHGYYSNYGYLSANFGATTYNWNGMQNEISGKYNFDMEQLQYHLGISVDMMYDPSGSGAYMWDDVDAMKTYFGYSSTTELFNRNDYSDTDWANLIIDNLDQKMPVQYAASGTSGGHAFVCDGYQGTDFFHFNWGWSGSFNNYYYLNNLNPGYTFNYGHQIVLNSYPATNFPQNCSGLVTITNSYGTIEDGSSPKYNYQDNKDCMWLIEPTEIVDNIRIDFARFETESSNDLVTIYDGASTSDPVLGVFSGNTLPAQITSTGNKVLVRFTTNGSINKNGWLLTYNANPTHFCNYLTELNSSSGTITDGSDIHNYSNNTSCNWRINLPTLSNVNINFNSFNLASDIDFIRIYDETNGVLVATFNSASLPQSLSMITNKVLITFITNNNNNDQGWSLNYNSAPYAVEENAGSYLMIAPNPATDFLNIETNLQNNKQAEVEITNVTGETVFTKKISCNGDILKEKLDVSHFAKGMYFLTLSGENFRKVQKFTIQ